MLGRSNQEMAESIGEEQTDLLDAQSQQALLEEQELYSEVTHTIVWNCFIMTPSFPGERDISKLSFVICSSFFFVLSSAGKGTISIAIM